MSRATSIIVCPHCSREVGRISEDFVVYWWNRERGKKRKLRGTG